jgi:serine/threonine protein kinase
LGKISIFSTNLLIFLRIAKLNEIHEQAYVNTETVSTLQYMSPEAMSQSIYTTASDIYAFGIVAYEILFEKQAFGFLEGFQLIDAVVNKQL